MYEYTPTSPKSREKLTALTLVCVAALLIIVSGLPDMILPALWQLGAVLSLTGAIYLAVRYLLRVYSYRVEGNGEGEPFDLTVTEQVGARKAVVCRIHSTDIEDVVPVTAENRDALRAKRKGKLAWCYYAERTPKELCQLTVRDGEDVFFVLFEADQTLLSFLMTAEKSNICPISRKN